MRKSVDIIKKIFVLLLILGLGLGMLTTNAYASFTSTKTSNNTIITSTHSHIRPLDNDKVNSSNVEQTIVENASSSTNTTQVNVTKFDTPADEYYYLLSKGDKKALLQFFKRNGMGVYIKYVPQESYFILDPYFAKGWEGDMYVRITYMYRWTSTYTLPSFKNRALIYIFPVIYWLDKENNIHYRIFLVNGWETIKTPDGNSRIVAKETVTASLRCALIKGTQLVIKRYDPQQKKETTEFYVPSYGRNSIDYKTEAMWKELVALYNNDDIDFSKVYIGVLFAGWAFPDYMDQLTPDNAVIGPLYTVPLFLTPDTVDRVPVKKLLKKRGFSEVKTATAIIKLPVSATTATDGKPVIQYEEQTATVVAEVYTTTTAVSKLDKEVANILAKETNQKPVNGQFIRLFDGLLYVHVPPETTYAKVYTTITGTTKVKYPKYLQLAYTALKVTKGKGIEITSNDKGIKVAERSNAPKIQWLWIILIVLFILGAVIWVYRDAMKKHD